MQPGGLVAEVAPDLDVDGHVGALVRDRLEAADRLPERDPPLRVLGGEVEGALAQPQHQQRLGGRAERQHARLQPRGAHGVAHRVVEADVEERVAVGGRHRLDRDAVLAGLDDRHLVDARQRHQEVRGQVRPWHGDAPVGEAQCAVRTFVCHCRRRPGVLGQRRDDRRGARGYLLREVGVGVDEREPRGDGRVDERGGAAALAHLLEHQRDVEQAAAAPAHRLGEGRAAPAELLHRGPELRVEAVAGAVRVADAVHREGAREEVARGLCEQDLDLVELMIHRRSPSFQRLRAL